MLILPNFLNFKNNINSDDNREIDYYDLLFTENENEDIYHNNRNSVNSDEYIDFFSNENISTIFKNSEESFNRKLSNVSEPLKNPNESESNFSNFIKTNYST